MTQTLLAMLALMLTLLFSYQQQRNVQHAQLSMIKNEVMSMATGVAVDRLEEIGSMAFDDATKGDVKLVSPSQLTLKANFLLDSPVDDMDDFDGSKVRRFRVVWADTLWYWLETQVNYASESNPDQEITDLNVRTKFKKASVKVYSANTGIRDTIRISQSFACGTKCAW
jgi:hypothetical protein